jgi:hypothetical protein
MYARSLVLSNMRIASGNRLMRVTCACVLLIVFDASVVVAQTRVRVTRDQATIWRRDAPIAATIVKAGTVLEVNGREGDWYVVVIPPGSSASGRLGLIAISQVEIVSGDAPQRPAVPERQRGREQGDARRPPAPIPRRDVGVFGFGQVGLGAWLAHDTFAAVLGNATTPMFGGGVQVRFQSLFVEGAAERYQKTGERVFVKDGEVFKLGIADRVTVTPVFATVGYRRDGRKYSGYGGAGAGRHSYKETFDFADPSEDVDKKFTSYHALGGVEFPARAWLRVAVEVQFTTVPNSLGASGASAAFKEHNLGGLQLRVKFLAGR